MTEFPRLTRPKRAPAPGIVHLGLGAFFRSHGALVIEDALDVVGGDWGILGVSLRSPGIHHKLMPQDFAYTAVEMRPDGQRHRVVSVLTETLFAPEAPDHLISHMADRSTRIVSLTITEKGYCHIPSTGALNLDHPDIQQDLTASHPKSAIGFIVRALQIRRDNGLRPFTILSCDNLPNNGQVARNVVTGLAAQIDKGLARWIEQEACFPATMVDRIVPATTEDDIAALATATGILDRAPVFHEPFLQWVIEDRFVDGDRPALDRIAGVQLVSNVAPFEHMKIRMLNGTHSALAYLGYLAGHTTIAETVSDPVFGAFVKILWKDEIIPTFAPPPGVDLDLYAAQLFSRYSNPAIQHRTWQIAMDGSQKLPQRILGTLADNLAKGRETECLCLSIAAWMRYVGGTDELGRDIDVRDPLAAQLRRLSDNADTPEQKVRALLSVTEVFGAEVHPGARKGIEQAFQSLHQKGARRAVQDCVSKTGPPRIW